jgi:hypothetical protein
MRPALILGDDRDAVGIVAVRAEAGGFVDGKLGVVAQFGAGEALRAIFMVERRPLAGEIDLCESGR